MKINIDWLHIDRDGSERERQGTVWSQGPFVEGAKLYDPVWAIASDEPGVCWLVGRRPEGRHWGKRSGRLVCDLSDDMLASAMAAARGGR